MSYDPLLFHGTAHYYRRYRPGYHPGFVPLLRDELGLDGSGRLLDVGCGTGNVAIPLAPLFTQAVGIDPDPDMVREAQSAADEAGVSNISWLTSTAEELPAGLGRFRLVTFGQSFKWLDQPRMVAALTGLLADGGAVAILSSVVPDEVDADSTPWPQIRQIIRDYLGDAVRAGSGLYRHQGPPEEAFKGSAFGHPQAFTLPPGPRLTRTPEDVLGLLYSESGCAQHLFGDRLGQFEADVYALLARHSSDGTFSYLRRGLEVLLFRRQG